MQNQIQIFQYSGSPITFHKGNSVMVNATEMAKPFGKSAAHWLRNQSTQEFLREYAALRNRNPHDLVQVVNETIERNKQQLQMHRVAHLKLIRIFATFYIFQGQARACRRCGHFLCSNICCNIAAVTPVWSVNAPTTALEVCRTTGKDSRFSVHNA